MEGKHRKMLGDAIRDGDAVETGIPLRADDYDVRLENRTDGTYFTFRPRRKEDEEE